MVPLSTSHFSLPTLTQPVRSLPLNSGTQSSPGSLGLGVWAASAPAIRTQSKVRTLLFCTQLGPNLRRDAVGETLDSLHILPFHHHARQWLGAGGAHQHTPGIAEGFLRGSDSCLHGGQILERLAL